MKRDLTSDTAEDKFDVAAEARRRGIEPYQVRAIGAVDDKLMADIVNDFRRPLSQSTSMVPDRQRGPGPQTQSRNGWADAAPLTQPPGIATIDSMCDAADRRDRLVRIQQELELARIEQLLDRKNPYKAKFEYSPTEKYDSEVPSLHREKK